MESEIYGWTPLRGLGRAPFERGTATSLNLGRTFQKSDIAQKLEAVLGMLSHDLPLFCGQLRRLP